MCMVVRFTGGHEIMRRRDSIVNIAMASMLVPEEMPSKREVGCFF